MKTYDNGTGYTVSFSAADADDFATSWPCSTVEGPGWFAFDCNGDLIDARSPDDDARGADWLVFSRDCQEFGRRHITALRRRHANKVKQVTQ